MSAHFELGFGFSWTDNCICPFQLVAECEDRWYITRRRLDQFDPIASHRLDASIAAWSRDGNALYLLDDADRLQKLEFGTSPLPQGMKDRTPLEWRSKRPLLRGACAVPKPASLFFLVAFFSGRRESVWALPEGTSALLPVLASDFPGLSCQLCCSDLGPLLVQENCPRQGNIRITELASRISRDYEVPANSGPPCSVSQCGKECMFSGNSFTDNQLQSLDLSTGDVRFLTNASYGTWSPDNSLIAAVRADEELVLLDKGGKRSCSVLASRHTPRRPFLPVHPPQWSPDGNWLVFALYQWERSHSIYENQLGASPNQCPSLEIVDQAAFVLDVRRRAIVRLPFFCQSWTWRPCRTVE